MKTCLLPDIKNVASIELPAFTNDDAGTFKPVSLEWLADEAGKGRTIGARLESKGPQIAWDNIRLEARP